MAKKNDDNDEMDSQLEALLGAAGPILYSDEVRSDVDGLLAAGQALEPQTRARFVAAATRAVRDRNLRTNAALETILFKARTETSRDASELAVAIETQPATIRDIESGERPITVATPALVARWAAALRIDRDSLANGLRNTFTRGSGVRTYAGESIPAIATEHADFLNKTLEAFDELTPRESDRG